MDSKGTTKARRQSPPTDRVVQILNLLAENPTYGYSVAEIVKALGITNATCHAILGSLVESRVLKRDARTKRYSLGPHLFSLGCDARKAIEGGAPVEDLLIDLCLETRCPCSAHALDHNDRLVVLHNLKVQGTPEGHEYVFSPPFGFSFVPWGPESYLTDWLGRSPLPISGENFRKLKSIIKTARRNGYLVFGMLSDLQVRLFELMSEHRADEITGAQHQELLLSVLEGIWIRGVDLSKHKKSSKVAVSSVVAPALDATGYVRFVIHLYLNKPDITVSELERYCHKVKEAADVVTSYLSAREPQEPKQSRVAGVSSRWGS